MKESKNIEKLFQESFSGYEVDPGKEAWSSIQAKVKVASEAGLESAANSSASNTGVWAAAGSKAFTAIVALGIAGISIGAFFFFNDAAKNNNPKETKPEVNQEQPLIQQENSSNTQELQEVDKPASNSAENRVYEETDNNSSNKSATKSETNTQSKPVNNPGDKHNSAKAVSRAEAEETTVNPAQEQNSNEPAEIQEEPVAETKNTTEEPKVADKAKEQSSSNKVDPKQENQVVNNNTNPLEEKETTAPQLPVLPNAFSPNSDNVNDVFLIETDQVDHMEVQIFNQTSKQVHSWSGLYGFWDGLMPNGTLAPEGIYIIRVVFTIDGKKYPKQSTINLYR